MKKSIITMALVVTTMLAYAENYGFTTAMNKNLQILRNTEQKIDFLELGNKFEQVASKNQNRYEPLYYAAYCYILGSWNLNNPTEKADLLDKAKLNIKKAEELSPENDELLVLEAFYFQSMIMVNPQMYGQSYSGKATMLLTEAQKLNPNNPRAAFLLAQNTYYTPEQYGGGKEKALSLFAKASELFKNQKTTDYLLPLWGEKTNDEMYLKCSY